MSDDFEKNAYIYQYKDRLGNARVTYNKDMQIVDTNNYYPLGNLSTGKIDEYDFKMDGRLIRDGLTFLGKMNAYKTGRTTRTFNIYGYGTKKVKR